MGIKDKNIAQQWKEFFKNLKERAGLETTSIIRVFSTGPNGVRHELKNVDDLRRIRGQYAERKRLNKNEKPLALELDVLAYDHNELLSRYQSLKQSKKGATLAIMDIPPIETRTVTVPDTPDPSSLQSEEKNKWKYSNYYKQLAALYSHHSENENEKDRKPSVQNVMNVCNVDEATAREMMQSFETLILERHGNKNNEKEKEEEEEEDDEKERANQEREKEIEREREKEKEKEKRRSMSKMIADENTHMKRKVSVDNVIDNNKKNSNNNEEKVATENANKRDKAGVKVKVSNLLETMNEGIVRSFFEVLDSEPVLAEKDVLGSFVITFETRERAEKALLFNGLLILDKPISVEIIAADNDNSNNKGNSNSNSNSNNNNNNNSNNNNSNNNNNDNDNSNNNSNNDRGRRADSIGVQQRKASRSRSRSKSRPKVEPAAHDKDEQTQPKQPKKKKDKAKKSKHANGNDSDDETLARLIESMNKLTSAVNTFNESANQLSQSVMQWSMYTSQMQHPSSAMRMPNSFMLSAPSYPVPPTTNDGTMHDLLQQQMQQQYQQLLLQQLQQQQMLTQLQCQYQPSSFPTAPQEQAQPKNTDTSFPKNNSGQPYTSIPKQIIPSSPVIASIPNNGFQKANNANTSEVSHQDWSDFITPSSIIGSRESDNDNNRIAKAEQHKPSQPTGNNSTESNLERSHISKNVDASTQATLEYLHGLGFTNRTFNLILLDQHKGNLEQVISELQNFYKK